MNFLANYGINPDATPTELERSIMRSIPMSSIANIRNDLFLVCKDNGLTAVGDVIVTRRKTSGGKTVTEKHVSDICHLVSSIKNRTAVPRTLLRNGKRSKEEFAASQNRHQNESNYTDLDQSCDPINSLPGQPPPESESTTMPSADDHQARPPSSLPDSESAAVSGAHDITDITFRSTIVNNISSLRSSIDSLREDV